MDQDHSTETLTPELDERAGEQLRALEAELFGSAEGPPLERVEAALAAERGPVAWLRARPTPVRRAMVGATIGLVLVLAWTAFGRVDMPLFPTDRLAVELGLLALVAVGLIGLGLRHGLREAPAWTGLFVLFVVALPTVAYFLPMAHSAHPASLAGAGSDLAARALSCFAWGMSMAAPVALVLALSERDPSPEWPRDGLAAGAAGVAGLMALTLHCPITQPIHLLVGHAPVVIGMIAVFALAQQVRGRLSASRARR